MIFEKKKETFFRFDAEYMYAEMFRKNAEKSFMMINFQTNRLKTGSYSETSKWSFMEKRYG